MRRRCTLIVALALALGALALTACGGSSSARKSGGAHRRSVTLILDFVPNAVHVGIYRALAAGYYRRAGINLRVIPPSSTSQTLALIDAGKAQFGLADAMDVAGQIAAGRDARAIMAVVQRPLGAPIALASEHLRSAADLVGRTVGITGVPSDRAVLDTVVAHAGGDPSKVRVVTIGFNGVTDLEAGKIAAFTGYWPDDGTTLTSGGYPITTFRLDQGGGPAYPGLVMFTTTRLLSRDAGLARAFVGATVAGYEDALRNPARALDDLLAANPALKRGPTLASLHAYLPIFDAGGVPYGTLVPAHVRALTVWLAAHRLTAHVIAAGRLATNAFLPHVTS